MRLINTATLGLRDERFGEEIPKYAILSHTWTQAEVTFREWTEATAATKLKSGYIKVRDACAVALARDHKWFWADTVCIDKTNLVELTEAINSMYAWYRDSVECLVYLADVDPVASDNGQSPTEQFAASRWFTRGWTLQELLAPSELTFYDRGWNRLGSRRQFADAIELATDIAARDLGSQFRGRLHRFSIAKRMSWMASRTTTRIEDMAYCMLGIFDINMPLLYGEGPKAFLRLQHEIMRTYHDHTIFASTWALGGVTRGRFRDFGVLATSPAAFAGLRHRVEYDADDATERIPYTITNLGLSIRLPALLTANGGALAILQAQSEVPSLYRHSLAIRLSRGRGVLSLRHGTFPTLSRAENPDRALRFCRQLPQPPLENFFLRIQPDRDHLNAEAARWDGGTPSACPGPYGLFLVFNGHPATLCTHPASCFDGEQSLTFSSRPSAWREFASVPSKSGTSFHVRTTAVVVCVPQGWGHRGACLNEPPSCPSSLPCQSSRCRCREEASSRRRAAECCLVRVLSCPGTGTRIQTAVWN